MIEFSFKQIYSTIRENLVDLINIKTINQE